MRGVPSYKYDEEYYHHNCDGFTDDGSLCRRLKMLLSNIPGDSIYKVFDIGCGRGEVAKELFSKGHDVISLDYSYGAMKFFKKNCGDLVPFIRHDISTGIPWITGAYFDFVVLADVIEHLYQEQLDVLSSEVFRILKPGGVCLIDTPIMEGGESELHVDIKNSVDRVARDFSLLTLEKHDWYKNPEHCNIIMRKP